MLRPSLSLLFTVASALVGNSVGASHGVPTTHDVEFKAYHHPTATYTGRSCVIDLSRYDDFTVRSKVGGCHTKVSLSAPFTKVSVPRTWRTWSCPPDTEDCKPDVLWSKGSTAVTIDFGTTVTIGGFEYEPQSKVVETVTVSFYSGPLGSGTLVGSITRDVDGSSGARLFGAQAQPGFRSAVVTNRADDEFAIAQIRV